MLIPMNFFRSKDQVIKLQGHLPISMKLKYGTGSLLNQPRSNFQFCYSRNELNMTMVVTFFFLALTSSVVRSMWKGHGTHEDIYGVMIGFQQFHVCFFPLKKIILKYSKFHLLKE